MKLNRSPLVTLAALVAFVSSPNYAAAQFSQYAEGRDVRNEVFGVEGTLRVQALTPVTNPCPKAQVNVRVGMEVGEDWDAPPSVFVHFGKFAVIDSQCNVSGWQHYYFYRNDNMQAAIGVIAGNANPDEWNHYRIYYSQDPGQCGAEGSPCIMLHRDGQLVDTIGGFGQHTFQKVRSGTQVQLHRVGDPNWWGDYYGEAWNNGIGTEPSLDNWDFFVPTSWGVTSPPFVMALLSGNGDAWDWLTQ